MAFHNFIWAMTKKREKKCVIWRPVCQGLKGVNFHNVMNGLYALSFTLDTERLANEPQDAKMYPFLAFLLSPPWQHVAQLWLNVLTRPPNGLPSCQFGSCDGWKCLITLLSTSSGSSWMKHQLTPCERSWPLKSLKKNNTGDQRQP